MAAASSTLSTLSIACSRTALRQLALPLLATLGLASGVQAQQAQQAAPSTAAVYVQAAKSSRGSDALTVGVALPWGNGPRWQLGNTPVEAYWDIYLSRWSASDAPGGRDVTALGLTPTFRFLPGGPSAGWFVDAGIGATYSNRVYVPAPKSFSTRFNFASHVGVGLQFGEQRAHELSLRVQHVSNASIKKPNPGENFLQLRYAVRF